MDAEELMIGNLVNIGEAIQSLPIEAGIHCAVLIAGKTQYFGTIRKISELKPILLTEKWLLKFGFEKMELCLWKGNGQDYQPETSKTSQQDYDLNGFIVRFENWSYRKTESDKWINEETVKVLNVSKWYLGIPSDVIVYDPKYIHKIQNLYFALKDEKLTIKEKEA